MKDFYIVSIIISVLLWVLAFARFAEEMKKYEWKKIQHPIPERIRDNIRMLIFVLLPILNVVIAFIVAIYISQDTIEYEIKKQHELNQERASL